MARRSARPGQWLVTDDYYGVTCYASELQRDYWGAYAKKPLQRNLQEIASPLADPYPVPFVRGPNYETSVPCNYERAPTYIGLTTRLTSHNNAAVQALNLFPGIGAASIGCTFIIS